MSDMADVLRAHWSASTHTDRKPSVDKCDGCGEVIHSWEGPTNGAEALAAHQSAALSAAGFGPVQEARADVLREAADALEMQPPHIRAQYVAILRLYAHEPWRLTTCPSECAATHHPGREHGES